MRASWKKRIKQRPSARAKSVRAGSEGRTLVHSHRHSPVPFAHLQRSLVDSDAQLAQLRHSHAGCVGGVTTTLVFYNPFGSRQHAVLALLLSFCSRKHCEGRRAAACFACHANFACQLRCQLFVCYSTLSFAASLFESINYSSLFLPGVGPPGATKRTSLWASRRVNARTSLELSKPSAGIVRVGCLSLRRCAVSVRVGLLSLWRRANLS